MKLGFSSLLAIRYLHSTRENRFFSWISILSVLGLAIGVAALILVLSVFDGFEDEVRIRMLQATAEITATAYPDPIADERAVIKDMRDQPEFGASIKAIAPFVQIESMAKDAAALRGVIMRGIDPRRQEKVQSFLRLVTPGNSLRILQDEIDAAAKGQPAPEMPSIIVGSRLLETLGSHVGATLWVLDASSGMFAGSKAFKVIGTFESGLKIYDDRIIVMSLTSAQNFARIGNKVSGFSIALHDPNQSQIVRRKIAYTYDQFSVKDWQSTNSGFFQIMESERTRVGLIVMLVALVAGFNILTAVFTSVTQRQREISILKALGTTHGQIMRVFLYQSSIIGVLGAVSGVILAASIAFALRNYPFLDLPEPYFLNSLPASYNPAIYGSVCLIAILICLAAGLYPALIASRVSPTEGMAGAGGTL